MTKHKAPGTTILGIDPGLLRTGWGIISMQGNALGYIACGVIKPDAKLLLHDRLRILHEQLEEIIARYKPHEAAIEETFVNINGDSTLKLGQARGAILLSLALAGLPVSDYAATLVKKSIVGVGRAEKEQVMMMVHALLPGANVSGSDAADALAVAICHANHTGINRVLTRAMN